MKRRELKTVEGTGDTYELTDAAKDTAETTRYEVTAKGGMKVIMGIEPPNYVEIHIGPNGKISGVFSQPSDEL